MKCLQILVIFVFSKESKFWKRGIQNFSYSRVILTLNKEVLCSLSQTQCPGRINTILKQTFKSLSGSCLEEILTIYIYSIKYVQNKNYLSLLSNISLNPFYNLLKKHVTDILKDKFLSGFA